VLDDNLVLLFLAAPLNSGVGRPRNPDNPGGEALGVGGRAELIRHPSSICDLIRRPCPLRVLIGTASSAAVVPVSCACTTARLAMARARCLVPDPII
jgi:hypothetical protein